MRIKAVIKKEHTLGQILRFMVRFSIAALPEPVEVDIVLASSMWRDTDGIEGCPQTALQGRR
jgi:hypothetical protein